MPTITRVYASGFGGAGTMHLIVGNAFETLCGRKPKGTVTDTRLFTMCKSCTTAIRKIVEADHAKALAMDAPKPSNSIQQAESVLKKLASKPSVVQVLGSRDGRPTLTPMREATRPEAAMAVTVARGQRWLCVKGRGKGKLIELEYVAGRAPLWWYRNLTAKNARMIGRITEAELHACWELRSCEHESIIDDCSACWCPFHGVALGQCDCRPKQSK